jgi:hypothetical protein
VRSLPADTPVSQATEGPPEPRGSSARRLSEAQDLDSGRKVLGFLLTALAVSPGAPFWFDVLNTPSVGRAMVKPGEKAGPHATRA